MERFVNETTQNALDQAELVEDINEISTSFVAARCLHIIADLGVADLIDVGAKAPARLAQELAVNADALARMMRLLSRHGVFEERGEEFAHSRLSRLLRTDHPKSQRAWIRMVGSDLSTNLIRHLDYSLQTGKSAVDRLDPPGLFPYLAGHPDDAGRFNAGMRSKAQGDIVAILNAYDFSPFAIIGDIGGGHGHLLRAVLKATPSARGVLFDLPHTIEEARATPTERLSFIAGDFFETPLPACNCYILMNVIHDWTDKESITIVKAVREAATPDARLLLCEMVLPERSGSPYALMMDVSMLAITGGRERKLSEYKTILKSSGWRLERAIPTDASMVIVESTVI